MATKTEHGYILVYVGKEHHLADIRGYAYEHRLNAEKKIGRRLRKGEIVHHKDHIKSNNAEDNLEVKKSPAHHLFEHRIRTDLKHPDEANYLIPCSCGCGEEILKYDDHNRPRNYVHGHNPSDSPTQQVLLDLINNKGVFSISGMVSDVLTITAVESALATLVYKKLKRGKYAPVGTPKERRKNYLIFCSCGCRKKIMKFDSGWRARKYISGHNMKNLKQ